jgi:integrase/recombinase XerD
MTTARRSQLGVAAYPLKWQAVEKIISAAPSSRDKLLLEVMAWGGLRRHEAAGLRPRDVDAESARLEVRAGKGGIARTVPIPERLARDLERFIREEKLPATKPVFGVSARRINQIVAHAAKLAKVRSPHPGIVTQGQGTRYHTVTPHLLRHALAHEFKRRGGSISALQALMGHADSHTTMLLYGRLTVDDIAAEVERVLGK